MRTLRGWASRVTGLFARTHWDKDIAEEFQSHLQMQIADNLRSGMTPEQARRDALLKAGGLAAATEAYRDRSTVPMLEHFVSELRFTVRQLVKRPAYSVTAIFVLALGMAVCAAIFAFVDAALIQPIPYRDPARLVRLAETSDPLAIANLSYEDYQDWKRSQTVLESFDAFTSAGFLMSTYSGTEPVVAGRVSAGFFRTLGVTPLLGRNFAKNEDIPGGPRVALLSYSLWQEKFGGNKNILGRPILLSGNAYTAIGVLPPSFHFAPLGFAADLWTTINPKDSSCDQRRSCHDLFAIGRLKEGVSVERALANLSAIAKRLAQQYPDADGGRGVSVIPLSEAIVGRIRPILVVLMSGAALLLLIAYVNVAGLILVRSEGRRREIAVRGALGASTARLTMQFATEAFVIVAASSVAALVFTNWGTQALKTLIPVDMLPGMPFMLSVSMNGRIVAFELALAALAAIVFTATALFHFSFSDMGQSLAEGSRGSAGKAWRRVGSRLVVVELATAMVLLVGASLFGKSLYQLLHVELGFRPDHLATIEVSAPDNYYGKDEQSIALGRDVLSEVETIPGVQSAALTTVRPANFNGNTDWIRIVGKPYDGKHIEVNERDVSANFFRTIGAKLLRGRYFTDAEDKSKPEVVIINNTLARKYFPGENPIGQQIGDTRLSPKSIKTIIGVVDDIREGELDSDIWPAEYHPFNQDPGDYFFVIARTSQEPQAALPDLRRVIRHLHSDIGVRNEATLEALINNSETASLHRSSAMLVSGFAAAALLLGIVGLYGVIAYSVSQRTREIGVRMALGAEHRSVYRLIVREAGSLAVLGIAIGAVAAIAAAALAHQLLFGVSSWDPQSLIAVAVLLGFASLLASVVPARRAASVNPMEALRAE
ncbi:MAG: ABC transporter permease [Acidobacteriaceae bacterium]|nr:ABC transporter permease [Acidobacteriaceae bacterium]